MKKITLLFVCMMCILVAGCGGKTTSKNEKNDKKDVTSTSSADDKNANAVLKCEEQNFSVETYQGKTHTFKDGDGLYIYTEDEGYIPYILIFKSDSTNYDAEEFLNDFVLEMEEHYGDDFEGHKSVKEYTKGGKKLLGVEYSYKISGDTVQAIRLIEVQDDCHISYIAKYPEDEGEETLKDLELAISTINTNPGSATTTSTASTVSTVKTEEGVVITETAAQKLSNSLVNYSNSDGIFTMKAPKGWSISTGGYDMSYWIHLYDPNQPTLGVFFLLESPSMTKSASAHNLYAKLAGQAGGGGYRMFADMIVADKNNIVESFYTQFLSACSFYATYDAMYKNFTFPQITDFKVLESWNNSTFVTSVALEDKIIHGTFTNALTQEKGEGIFTGSAVNSLTMYQDGIDCGCFVLYNVSGIFAPYGQLNDYREVLMEIMNSITYSEDFVKTVIKNNNIAAQGAKTVAQIMGETSDIVVSGWEARQKVYDVTAAKYSDAILGYERVYNVETLQVYEADAGFMETYSGTTYMPITDDMYSEKISGHLSMK